MKLAAAVALGFAALTNIACAQTYPDHPIRIIIGYPGGPIDTSSRLIAADMSKRFGQPVVVDAMPGANSLIAGNTVLKAKPDGYTLLYGAVEGLSSVFNTENAVNADPQLTAITNLAITPYALMVSGKLPVRSLADLVAYSKANPGKLNLGAIQGGAAMLLGALAKSKMGIDSVYVPFNTNTPVIQGMVSGEIGWTTSSPSQFSSQFASGAIRPLFALSDKRLANYPTVPTSAEAGLPGFTAGTGFGLWGPGGLPRDIVMKLNEAANASIKVPEIAAKFAALDLVLVGSTPEGLVRDYQESIKQLVEGAKASNFKPVK